MMKDYHSVPSINPNVDVVVYHKDFIAIEEDRRRRQDDNRTRWIIAVVVIAILVRVGFWSAHLGLEIVLNEHELAMEHQLKHQIRNQQKQLDLIKQRQRDSQTTSSTPATPKAATTEPPKAATTEPIENHTVTPATKKAETAPAKTTTKTVQEEPKHETSSSSVDSSETTAPKKSTSVTDSSSRGNSIVPPDNGWWKRAKDWWFHHHHPTRLAGGGRDWVVNGASGKVSAKLRPDLFLGVNPDTPLVLVKRDSPQQLVFDEVPSASNGYTVSLTTFDGLHVGLKTSTVQNLDDEIRYIDAIVGASNVAPVTVEYVEDNFLYLPQLDLTLDVAWWQIVEGNHVDFAGGPGRDYTLVKGGATGRDWAFGQDGTLSPKGNPNLVLGCGVRGLMLVPKQDGWVMEFAAPMAQGAIVPMIMSHPSGQNDFVGIGGTDLQFFGPWVYSESIVVPLDDAFDVYWDGNFILLGNDSLALDVSYWNMEEGNIVNFVGSGDPHQQSEGLYVSYNSYSKNN